MFQAMFLNRNAVVTSLMVLGLGVGTAGAVSAATCEDFKITFKNATNDELKVKKFEYEDGNWKTETGMFGADGFQKIEHGKSIYFTRNLGGIGGETTHFKVTYQHRSGGTVWGDDMVEYTDTFTCTDNGAKTVTLDR